MSKILKATFLILLLFMGVYFSVFYTDNQSFDSILLVFLEAFVYAFSMTYLNTEFQAICIKPFKKVPVVSINLLHDTFLPSFVSKPFIIFLLKKNFITGSEKTFKLQ